MARTKGSTSSGLPTAVPPVCRIGDYGRRKYEQSKKRQRGAQEAAQLELREVKLRPKIDVHGLRSQSEDGRASSSRRRKSQGHDHFRGREITYTRSGNVCSTASPKISRTAPFVEREAKLEGKNMFLIMAREPPPLGSAAFRSLEDRHGAPRSRDRRTSRIGR